MAQKQQTIKNNSGQALIETLFLLPMTGVFLFFLLRCLISVIFTIALEAMAEDYFYCELAQKPNCESKLESRLRDNQLRDIIVKTQKSGQKIILTVTATHLASMTINREFDYEKFKRKF